MISLTPSRWFTAAVFSLTLSVLPTIFPAPAAAQMLEQEKPRVVDELGRPIEGARVYIQTRPHFPIPEEIQETTPTLTGSDGRVTLPEPLPPDSLIVVAKPGFVTRGFSTRTGLPDEIELAAGDKLLGSVANDKGVTISGALIGPPIMLGQSAMVGHRSQPLLYARTGEDGLFELDGVARGKYEVLVQAPGAVARLVPINTGMPKRVVLDTEGTTVTGLVRGSRDKLPKPDTYVEASAPGIKMYQRTDAQGRFTFPFLKDGEWQFRAVVPEQDVRHPVETVELKAQPEPHEIALLLSQGVRIAGYVFDAETSAPIADMPLMLDTEPRREVKTDAQGRFEFENVELFADPVLRFDAIKYTYQNAAGEPREYVEIPNVDGVEITTLTIPLRPRPFITGTVVDIFKRPVMGATIRARSLDGATERRGKNLEEVQYTSRSRADGTFRLLVNPAGRYELVASTEQFVSELHNAETWTTAPADVTLEVKPAATVAGTVTDAQDKPVVGATVEVRVASETGELEPETVGTGRLLKSGVSTEQGFFEITGFAPGKVDIVASHADYGQKAKATVDLLAGTSPSISLKFPSGNDFSALVTRQDGGAVPGAEVKIYFTYAGQQRAATSETNGRGVVAFRSLPTSKLDRISIRNPQYVDFEQSDLPLPQTDYPIVLRPRGSIAVTVDEVAEPADPKQALQALLLRADETGDAEPDAGRFTVIDYRLVVGGKARFEQLEPGWYKAAAKRGSLYSESEAKKLSETATTELSVVLEAGGSIRGKAFDKQTNQPVADVVVTASPAVSVADIQPVTAVTAADGTFQLTGVPAGVMELKAAHPDFPDWVDKVTVPSRGTVEVPVILSSEKATLSGVVRYGGQGMPNALLVLHKAGAGESPVASAVSEADGQYTFEPVPPGNYVLTVEIEPEGSNQTRHKQADVTVTAPESRQDIAFGLLTTVTGSVKVAGLSKPPVGRSVLFMPLEGGSSAMAPIKDGGTYETQLEAGTYTVGLDDSPGYEVQVPPPSDKPHRLDLSF